MILQKQLFEEIELIPAEKYAELYDLLHYFRLGLKQAQKTSSLKELKYRESNRESSHKSKFEDTPAFNLWKDRNDMADVENYVENLRKPRQQNVY